MSILLLLVDFNPIDPRILLMLVFISTIIACIILMYVDRRRNRGLSEQLNQNDDQSSCDLDDLPPTYDEVVSDVPPYESIFSVECETFPQPIDTKDSSDTFRNLSDMAELDVDLPTYESIFTGECESLPQPVDAKNSSDTFLSTSEKAEVDSNLPAYQEAFRTDSDPLI
ncbi:hypothetical protein SK128_026333 [Halocaridina rubra]|uniref:Uncharacterized protein n=1 Tax=Halocaridina rubra TaxID=373956 RepID=A0AAN8WKI5_HALRR